MIMNIFNYSIAPRTATVHKLTKTTHITFLGNIMPWKKWRQKWYIAMLISQNFSIKYNTFENLLPPRTATVHIGATMNRLKFLVCNIKEKKWRHYWQPNSTAPRTSTIHICFKIGCNTLVGYYIFRKKWRQGSSKMSNYWSLRRALSQEHFVQDTEMNQARLLFAHSAHTSNIYLNHTHKFLVACVLVIPWQILDIEFVLLLEQSVKTHRHDHTKHELV